MYISHEKDHLMLDLSTSSVISQERSGVCEAPYGTIATRLLSSDNASSWSDARHLSQTSVEYLG
jgi:hypothetical protein